MSKCLPAEMVDSALGAGLVRLAVKYEAIRDAAPHEFIYPHEAAQELRALLAEAAADFPKAADAEVVE